MESFPIRETKLRAFYGYCGGYLKDLSGRSVLCLQGLRKYVTLPRNPRSYDFFLQIADGEKPKGTGWFHLKIDRVSGRIVEMDGRPCCIGVLFSFEFLFLLGRYYALFPDVISGYARLLYKKKQS